MEDMKMKKAYDKPEMEVISVEDVITTSGVITDPDTLPDGP